METLGVGLEASLHAKDDVGAQLAGEHGRRRSSRRDLARVRNA
jgi:hypothetical protein